MIYIKNSYMILLIIIFVYILQFLIITILIRTNNENIICSLLPIEILDKNCPNLFDVFHLYFVTALRVL